MELINSQTSKLRSIHSIPARHLSFKAILSNLGRNDDPFYVIDSLETGSFSTFLRPVKTDDVSILFIEKGELMIRLEEDFYTLTEATILVKPPNTTLQILRTSDNCHFRIFGFMQRCLNASGQPIKHLETLALSVADTDPFLLLNESDATSISALLTLFQQKGKQNEKSSYYDESIHLAFSLFSLEIASLFKKKTHCPSGVTRKEYLAMQFLKLSRENIKEHRSVTFYAGLLFVTPKHLSKCIKQVTGKTCGEVIEEMVVVEAKTLLGDPSLSIAQVADELHFSDQFFFSKYFKKRTGLSPLLYRTAV